MVQETMESVTYTRAIPTRHTDLTPSGNVYSKITFELRYPVSLNPQATIYVLAFLEAGRAWYSLKEYNPFKMNRAAGIGVRANLPMFGLLGVDWGYGFDQVPIREHIQMQINDNSSLL